MLQRILAQENTARRFLQHSANAMQTNSIQQKKYKTHHEVNAHLDAGEWQDAADKLNARYADNPEHEKYSRDDMMHLLPIQKSLIEKGAKIYDYCNGYDLALMLLKDKKLENNVLYLGFHDDVLHYKCIDPDGKYQENTIT
ncbi:MAG: hypothetical protein GY821_09500, partial [Gammaproteobacteria bacterium]|nr:hypothetical protein [Gammaproteobacteria bacterium]